MATPVRAGNSAMEALRTRGRDGVKLFVVDLHTIYRRGLSVCLEALPEVESVGQAGRGRTAWGDEGLFAADLVIVDPAMPGGPDFVGAVAEAASAPVVVCT